MQELYCQATRAYRKGDSTRSFHGSGEDNARGVRGKSSHVSDQIRAGYQPQDCQDTRLGSAVVASCPRRRDDRVKRLRARVAVWSNSGQRPIIGLWTTPTQPMNWTAFASS